MKVKTHCPECNMGPDSIKHFLFECPRSKEVWRQLGLIDVVKRRCTQFKSGEEVVHELLSMEETEVQILGLPKLRRLWPLQHGIYCMNTEKSTMKRTPKNPHKLLSLSEHSQLSLLLLVPLRQSYVLVHWRSRYRGI